jgi:hypothetical protein
MELSNLESSVSHGTDEGRTIWSIVEGTEETPAANNADLTAKFDARRDRALASSCRVGRL